MGPACPALAGLFHDRVADPPPPGRGDHRGRARQRPRDCSTTSSRSDPSTRRASRPSRSSTSGSTRASGSTPSGTTPSSRATTCAPTSRGGPEGGGIGGLVHRILRRPTHPLSRARRRCSSTAGVRRPDYVFYGIGPGPAIRSEPLRGGHGRRRRAREFALWRASKVETGVGVRSADFYDGHYGGDPGILQSVTRLFALPDGFAAGTRPSTPICTSRSTRAGRSPRRARAFASRRRPSREATSARRRGRDGSTTAAARRRASSTSTGTAAS